MKRSFDVTIFSRFVYVALRKSVVIERTKKAYTARRFSSLGSVSARDSLVDTYRRFGDADTSIDIFNVLRVSIVSGAHLASSRLATTLVLFPSGQ